MQDQVATLACDAGLRFEPTCDGGCWLVGDSSKTCEAEAFACWACKRMGFCGVGALKYVRCSEVHSAGPCSAVPNAPASQIVLARPRAACNRTRIWPHCPALSH